MGEELRERVKQRYAGAARSVLEGAGSSSCCGLAGEVVLDLGSGGGIDGLLSAKRVSPGGKAYGLDMTDEMLELAEKNRAEAAAENAEFLKGRIAVSDMVFLGDKGKLPPELVRSMEAWSGCVSGALEKDEYEELLREAGFEDVSVEVTHTYDEEFAVSHECCGGSGCCGDTAAATEVPLASAFIPGRKPATRGT